MGDGDKSPRWVFRTNRAFGVMEQNETVSFEHDDDPVMVGLVGAGYVDLVSGPPLEGIASEESVGKPTLKQSKPKSKKKDVSDE